VGDVDREIKRLSQRFGTAPHILQSPQRSRGPLGVIAYWGDVTLMPLDSHSLAQLAAGQSVMKGMLFDFLGNFGESAREGFPIFQLGGASGYIWGAHFDENGKGSLRMTAIDASQFSGPPQVAKRDDVDSSTAPYLRLRDQSAQAVHRHLIRNQRSACGRVPVFSSVRTGMF